MNTVKMLKTVNGSQDGLTVTVFKKDEIYQLSDSLYKSFKQMEVAVDVKPTKTIENKAEQNTTENKTDSGDGTIENIDPNFGRTHENKRVF